MKSQVILEKTNSIVGQIESIKDQKKEDEQAAKVREYYKLIGQQTRRTSAKEMNVQPKNKMMPKL